MSTHLFKKGTFTSAAGLELHWKIECDALSDEEWAAIAFAVHDKLPRFGAAVGVPRGGLPLAQAMEQYATTGPVLIVDDVWTTGKSLRRVADQIGRPEYNGFVAFARGPLPPNVKAFMHTEF